VIDAVEIELFNHRFAAIAEEMGELLTRTAFSPNIKERRDHSCAIFDENGDTVAQAAHIPVHLGSAPLCVKAVIGRLDLQPGQTAIVNDPFAGGTHLPDITLVTAVLLAPGLSWYVATRAHHADVGGIAPGSLPPSRTIDDEGWRIAPALLDETVAASLLAASRTPDERRGDLAAQKAANALGARRLAELGARHGADRLRSMAAALTDYSERCVASVLAQIPDGEAAVEDYLDDARGDGHPIRLALWLKKIGGTCILDFSACDPQVEGPMNAVRAIVESAVLYVLVCLAGEEVPANAGALRPATILTRPGTVVDAVEPAAVAAGNVETSQRLVDVVLQAFSRLAPERVPAASYGSMNNVLIGSVAGATPAWVYYETVGGGHGASALGPGASAMQAHMTNTLNTPVEALELAYGMRIEQYAIRDGSGGAGRFRGGDGIVRAWHFCADVEVTVIADRRRFGPPGAEGGGDGAVGRQYLVEDERVIELGGKFTRRVRVGSTLVVETPGGGGWGSPD
jgi:N-methylhydantoinase B